MKRAILGGTFDPPHLGHLSLARSALAELDLEEAWLVPAHIPPHKAEAHAGPFHRFAMTALCCDDEPALRPHPVELRREGRSLTLHTLEELDREGEGPFVLLMGADTLADFPNWHRPEKILDMAALGAVPRAGLSMEEIIGRLPPWLGERVRPAGPAETGSVVILSATPPAVSSTTIRERIAGGEDASELLAPAVARFIRKTGLYIGRQS